MYQLQSILEGINPGFENEEITTTTILTMLMMVSIFSFYEFLVSRYLSKRSFYSKHFNISLAIIHFRTAFKDPLDMVYLFWSVHTGLYEVAFFTSVVVTVFILLLDYMPLGKAPYLLVLNIQGISEEESVLALINQYPKNVNVKSRNFSSNGIDMIAEVRTKEEAVLMQEIVKFDSIKAASLVAYDGEKEF